MGLTWSFYGVIVCCCKCDMSQRVVYIDDVDDVNRFSAKKTEGNLVENWSKHWLFKLFGGRVSFRLRSSLLMQSGSKQHASWDGGKRKKLWQIFGPHKLQKSLRSG
jgi:hypothetical protein